MRRIIIAFLISIMMLAGANTVKADLPPDPSQAASQENCFAILGHTDLYIDRKGVEKGPVAMPATGTGVVRYSNGYLIITWTNETLLWIYHIETGFNCYRDIQDYCEEGVVDPGQSVVVACPTSDTMVEMTLDCTNHWSWIPIGTGPATMSQSPSTLLVGINGDNHVGQFQAGGSVVMHYDTGITGMQHIRYHAATNAVYYNGNNGSSGIFFKDVPLVNTPNSQTLVQLPNDTTFMSINDTHILASDTGSAAYLIEIANPSSYQTINMSDSRANALSHDTAYVSDIGVNIETRAYDMQGNERNFSPLPFAGYSIAYIKPHVAPVCNNGLIEPGEVCDGSDFDGATCVDHGFDGGDLGCNLSCDAISTVNCYTCGDGVQNPGEDCDGNELGPGSCTDYGYASGDLSCNSSCEYDTSGCYTCGDGFIEGAEQCESNDLNNGTCQSEGFVSGNIACGTDCMYDTSGCSSCGDNIINGSDVCDGNAINDVCQTLGQGFTGGTLACNSTCDGYDTSGCTTCGNGSVDPDEECDSNDLDQETCQGLGFTGGTLGCYANCTYDTSQCQGAPTEICGNNVVDPGEECDDGDRQNGDGCDENCMLEPDPANCGNNVIEGTEECDGTELDGVTCESLGYDSGIVYCQNNCLLSINCSFANFQPANLNIEPGAGAPSEVITPEYEEVIGSRTESCIPSMDGSDLIMTTPENGYCPIELNYGGQNPSQKSKQGKVFIMIYKPTYSLNNENGSVRIKPDGTFNIEGGGHMRAQLWVTPTNTFNNEVTENTEASMSLRMEFLSVNPKTSNTGRFALIEIASGMATYCSVAQPNQCANIPSGAVYILDFDNLEDSLGQIGRKPKKSGCSVAGGSNSEIPALMMVIMLILAIRIRRQKKAANR